MRNMLWPILFGCALFAALVALLRFAEKRLMKRIRNPIVIRLVAVLLVAVQFVAAVYGMFYFAQDLALFHPGYDQESWSDLTSQPDYEAVRITSGRRTWHGMLRRVSGEEPLPLIVFFYGNADTASHAMQQMDRAGLWPYFNDYHCLMVDYTGYGHNSGRPSAKNMYEAALAAYDYAAALPDVSRVIAGGYSIGTGPAVYLAANRDVGGLFLMAPYASGFDLYNSVLPVFYGPLRLFVRHRFPSDRYAQAVRVPALVIASRDDELIPFDSSERLSRCFGAGSHFVVLDGVDHSWILHNPAALESVKNYLDTLVSP